MEPIIYKIPKSDTLNLSDLKYTYDSNPSPKLIKYGYNVISNKIDYPSIIKNPYHKVGLNYDFDRTDDKSIRMMAQKKLGVKSFTRFFGELWEIVLLFKLLSKSSTIYVGSDIDTVKSIISTYSSIYKSTHNYQIDNNLSSKSDLVIEKYSDIDLDEDAVVQTIFKKIPDLLSVQKIGSTMVLQIFNIQTHITCQLIYLLSSLYQDSYIIKPNISSILSDSKYLVLQGLLSHPKNINYPIYSINYSYLYLINIIVPEEFDIIIQCLNSDIIPKKFNRFLLIESYLKTKVYEGATYDELIECQNNNTIQWLNTFGMDNNTEAVINNAIEKSSKTCVSYVTLSKLYLDSTF
jgi:hypothetical protein